MREDSRYRRVERMVASLLACLLLHTSMVFVEHISWSEPRCALFRALSDLRARCVEQQQASPQAREV